MKINDILSQLQRRRVPRAAALYAAFAWALLQVADVMFPIIGLSENAITMVLLLALAGFPLSLVLSWVFEFRPSGLEQTSDALPENPGERVRITPIRVLAIIASLFLFIMIGYLYLERLSEHRQSLFSDETTAPEPVELDKQELESRPLDDRPSIAVLPFVNFSDVRGMDHFGDGLAEEILNLLARLDELQVAARTSSFYFKDKNIDIAEIADYLGVRYILEGSVRHSGEKIRVTAQLIDATSGFHLWSNTYDRSPVDIFQLQDEIGRQVVQNLQLTLSKKSKESIDRQLSIDPSAYEFYLRGREYLRRPGDDSAMQNAEKMFLKAVELAPEYAEAFAGLCDTLLQQYSVTFEKLRFEAAEVACQKALALDKNSPAVHIALGNLYRESGQYALSEREFNRALSVHSNAVDAYVGLADTFIASEKITLAEQTLHRAIELEPKNWEAAMAMGLFLFDVGRIEESISYFERINDLIPESNVAANNLGSAYFLSGRFDDAARAWEQALEGEEMAELYANLGSSYFFLGKFDDAVEKYRKALELEPEIFGNWGNLADAYQYSRTQSGKARETYQRAITLAEQHLEINPSDAEAVAASAHYLANIGQRDAAIARVKLAKELARLDMYVYYFSASAHCATQDPVAALNDIGEALQLGYPAHMVQADPGLACTKGLPGYQAVIDGRYKSDRQ